MVDGFDKEATQIKGIPKLRKLHSTLPNGPRLILRTVSHLLVRLGEFENAQWGCTDTTLSSYLLEGGGCRTDTKTTQWVLLHARLWKLLDPDRDTRMWRASCERP